MAENRIVQIAGAIKRCVDARCHSAKGIAIELSPEDFMAISLDSNSLTKPSTLARDGEALYNTELRAALEPQHSGEFVAIEPFSGCHFLGQTATAALVTARNAMLESQFFLTRIGRSFAHKILSQRFIPPPSSAV